MGLFKKGIVEGFDDEGGYQNKEAFTYEGVAMLDCYLGPNLTAYKVGASHK